MIKASTSDVRKVKLSISVEGMGMSAIEAQKFAKNAQSSLCYHLGVDCENLEVEVTADEAPSEDEATKFANSVSEEDM